MCQLFCRTYGGLRERVVATADDWIGDDGEFLAFPWIAQRSHLVVERFHSGDYEQSEALFLAVEQLLTTGDDAVQSVVATGFLEGLQHQSRLQPKFWRPFLGPLALAHCVAMDKFHGFPP